jgi:hypothetical protein
MNKATDLRRMADLCRRMAAVPTSGGHCADRQLLLRADKLDREAVRVGGAKQATVGVEFGSGRRLSQPRFSRIGRYPANGASSGLMMMALANWRFSPVPMRGGRRYGTP